jgi:phosphoribosylaminoimidazole (AIR) synthetase
MDYKEAGVDIEKGDAFVDEIKTKVEKTFGLHRDRIVESVGGFACLFDMQDGRYLSAGTDGVGTKLKLAFDLGKHDTIGIDLVAMCANDVVCTGAPQNSILMSQMPSLMELLRVVAKLVQLCLVGKLLKCRGCMDLVNTI